ncbi:hypothetical protein EDD86DRAFT_247213 [Gorgonomyces haynaldii]|nr:hypothetical protein EDD86DRAFT_247213 [Gorgonomyces haynaldii]
MLVTTLNIKEEEAALQKAKKNARTQCKDVVEQLIACTRYKTFSLYFGACEKERKISSECLSQYTNELALSEMREQVLKDKIQFLKDHNKFPQISQESLNWH